MAVKFLALNPGDEALSVRRLSRIEVHLVHHATDPIPPSKEFSGLIFSQSSSSLECMKRLGPEWQLKDRIFIGEKMSADDMGRWINEYGATALFTPGELGSKWDEFLKNRLERWQREKKRESLRSEVNQKRKDLEVLNEQLEALVLEKTQSLEVSNRDQSARLKRERDLVRFVKDCSAVNNFEDLFLFLRKELKKNPTVSEVFWTLRSGKESSDLYYFKSEIQRKSVGEVQTWSKALANILGRPTLKVLRLPVGPRASVLVEGGFQGQERGKFLVHWNDISGVAQMVFDRIWESEQTRLLTQRWEKTFHDFEEPLASFDANGKLRSCNPAFSNLSPTAEDLKRSEIETNNHIYQTHRFQVAGEGQGFVIYLSDQSQTRRLQAQAVQNDKLQALGELAGHLAHEMNNPLTGIMSLSQWLLQSADIPAESKKDLSDLERACVRCQAIIRNLMDFSKGELGDVELVSVDTVLEKTLPILKMALRPYKLDLELGTKNHLAKVEPHLLQQVFFNIINNACQAMSGKGEILIRTEVVDKLIRVSIQDTGPGIPSDIRDKVFEPFFTTKKGGQGTGLGLHLSKSIVQKFGGDLRFDLKIQHGTVFYIELPIAKSVEI